MTQMPLRRGVHATLEAAADALIKESLKNVTRHADKSDILTPWKQQERTKREVMVPSGVPDPAVRSGIFPRSINPRDGHLNSRLGQVRGKRVAATYSDLERSDSFGDVAPSFSWDAE